MHNRHTRARAPLNREGRPLAQPAPSQSCLDGPHPSRLNTGPHPSLPNTGPHPSRFPCPTAGARRGARRPGLYTDSDRAFTPTQTGSFIGPGPRALHRALACVCVVREISRQYTRPGLHTDPDRAFTPTQIGPFVGARRSHARTVCCVRVLCAEPCGTMRSRFTRTVSHARTVCAILHGF